MPSGCWEWQACKNWGYGAFKYKGKMYRTHRLAWILKNGEIPDGKIIMHKCDNRACINVSHLQVGTLKENTQDMLLKGRNKPTRGAKARTCTLSEKEAVEIVRVFSSKIKGAAQLSKEFGVTKGTIYDIMRGRSWTYVTGIKREIRNAK